MPFFANSFLHPLTMVALPFPWGGALLGLMIAQKHWGCMP